MNIELIGLNPQKKFWKFLLIQLTINPLFIEQKNLKKGA